MKCKNGSPEEPLVFALQEVADFVVRRIANGMEPEIICEELMTRCLATDNNMGGLGCDNMTVVLVCFLHSKPYQQYVRFYFQTYF